MRQDEVFEIITLLREAATTLQHVRADLGELAIIPSSIIPDNRKIKLQIDRGVLSAEVALREALDPIEWIDK